MNSGIIKKLAKTALAGLMLFSSLSINPVTPVMAQSGTRRPEPVCTKEEHTHDDSCYEDQLICQLEESEEHTHTDECYESVLICTKDEHTHTEADDCYVYEIPVNASVVWGDNANDMNTRPQGSAFVSALDVVDKTTGTGYELKEAATYTGQGDARGTVAGTVVVPSSVYDPSHDYGFVADQNKTLGLDNPYFAETEGNEITMIQSRTFDVMIQGIDGAHTSADGNHVDFITAMLEGSKNPLHIYANGEEINSDDLAKQPYVKPFDPSTGVGIYEYPYLPMYKIEKSGGVINVTPISYTLTITESEYDKWDTKRDDAGQPTPEKLPLLRDGDDLYKIEYDNTEVANAGWITTHAVNGGTIKLTLKDYTKFNATKYWLDQDPANRPTATFALWRYTAMTDGSKSYKTAAPVRDGNNAPVVFSVDGKTQGTSTALTISTEDGALVKLPRDLDKYDANGYQYVYFLRETVSGNGYEMVRDILVEVDDQGNVINVVDGGNPSPIPRDETDESIYNNGNIANRITAPVTPSVTKSWQASAYIDDLAGVKVEMTLWSRVKGAAGAEWQPTSHKDTNPGDFSSAVPAYGYSATVEKYDKFGRELEYEWRESAVYDADGTNKFDQTTNQIVLQINKDNMNPGNNNYAGMTFERQNNEYFEPTLTTDGNIVNKLKGENDYIVEKQWQDADGNDISNQYIGTQVTFNIRNSQNDVTVAVTVDGTDNAQVSVSDTTGAYANVGIKASNGWIAQVANLPKYTEDGILIEYSVKSETPTGDWKVSIQPDNVNRYALVVNAPPTGLDIPVEKKWVDDNDSACRYPSFVDIVYVDPTTRAETVVTPTPVELNFSNGWYRIYGINSDAEFFGGETTGPKWDISNYYAKEVSLNGTYKVETGYNQYGAEGEIDGTVTTDNHMYVVSHGYDDIEDALYVQNRRVGTVDVTVTKTWLDKGADPTKRPQADVVLSVNEGNATVSADKVTVEGVKTTELKTKLPVDRTVDSGVKFWIDQAGISQKEVYTFEDLPKYDINGKVITYSANENLAANNLDYIKEVSTTFTAENTKPQPGEGGHSEEEHDLLEVTIVNRRSATYDVKFYKEWNDDYAYNNGNRPDIFVDLYSTNKISDNGELEVSSKSALEPLREGYKTNVWSTDDRAGRNSAQGYWMVTFRNQPKYDADGHIITYYASEQTNGSQSQFDYKDTLFRGSNLSAYETVDNDTLWVVNGSAGIPVLHETGTFVNTIEKDIKLVGTKQWNQIPDGFQGQLPTIDINTKVKEAYQADTAYAQLNDKAGDNVKIEDIETPVGKRTVKWDIEYEDSRTTTADYYYDYSPDKYNAKGIIYNYKFEETIHESRDASATVMNNLYESSFDANTMTILNSYSNVNYKAQVALTKEWENRPVTDNYDVYPTTTFKIHRVWIGTKADGTLDYNKYVVESNLATQTIQSTAWKSAITSGTPITVNFDNKKFDIFAPDGFKYIYWVTEDSIKGQELANAISTNVTAWDPAEFKVGNTTVKNGFTFNHVENTPEVPVIGGGSLSNSFDPVPVTLAGQKSWTDNSNNYKTRPTDTSALGLKIYRKATGINNGAWEEITDKVHITWDTTSTTNVWEYTVTEKDTTLADKDKFLQHYAANGQEWTYAASETLQGQYATFYTFSNGNEGVSGITNSVSQNGSWNSTTKVHTINTMTNTLKTTEVAVTKNWDNKMAFALHPEVVFELQYKLGDGSWNRVKDNAMLMNGTNGIKSKYYSDHSSQTDMTITKPAEVSAVKTFVINKSTNNEYYEKQTSGLPKYMKDTDGTIKEVTYRLIEIKVAGENLFTEATAGNALLDPVVYPTEADTDQGHYWATISGTTITNHLKGYYVNLEVEKKWEKDANYTSWRSEVTFTVQRKLKSEPASAWADLKDNNGNVATLKVNSGNNWKAKAVNLPKYADNNVEYEYRAIEKTTPVDYIHLDGTNGTENKDKHISYTNDDGTLVYSSEATNELITIDVDVEKIWDGTPLSSVNLALEGKTGSTVRVTKSGNLDGTVDEFETASWKGEWKDVPKTKGGTTIAYTVYELNSSGARIPTNGGKYNGSYATTYSSTTDNDGNVSTTITNREVTSVSVTKVWNDASNQDAVRPTAIKVQLKKNGENEGTPVELNAGNKWYYNWPNLTKLDSSDTPYTYSVVEIATDGAYGTEVALGKNCNEYYILEKVEHAPKTGNEPGEAWTFTNKHTPEEVEVHVTKVWDDANDLDQIRPTELTFKVKNGSKDVDTITLSAGDDGKWIADELSGTSIKLPKYAGTRTPIVYTVEETKGAVITGTNGVGTYAFKVEQTTADDPYSFTVTNTHTPQLVNVSVAKVWDDSDDKDGIRPTSISFNVKDGSTVVDTITLTAKGDNGAWLDADLSGTSKDLPKHRGTTEIEYTVEEVTDDVVITGTDGPGTYSFTFSHTGNNWSFENKHTPEEIQVQVTKIWTDGGNQDGIRPTTLSFNVKDGSTVVDTITLTAKGDNGTWLDADLNGTSKKLPKYDNKRLIAYTVEEVTAGTVITGTDAEGTYKFSVEKTDEAGYQWTATNEHTPIEIQIDVTKIWTDNNNQDGIRPTELNFDIFNPKNMTTPVDTITLTAKGDNGTWLDADLKGTSKKLPKYEGTTTPIAYVLKERETGVITKADTATSYVFGVTQDSDYAWSVENTHTPITTNVEVYKAFDDEKPVAGDSTKIENRDGIRPTSVQMQLFKDGTADPDHTAVTLDSRNNWHASWIDLPKYRLNTENVAVEIVYTVKELKKGSTDPADEGAWYDVEKGYSVSYGTATGTYTPGATDSKNNDKVMTTVTVTNTHVPEKISIPVEKVWDDNDDQDGIRPESVQVKLSAQNDPTFTAQTVTLDESNSWKYTFTDLYKYYNDGTGAVEVKYLLEEITTSVITGEDGIGDPDVDNDGTYALKVDGNNTGYTVTNSHTPEVTNVAVTKVWDDELPPKMEDRDGLRPEKIKVQLVKNGTPEGEPVELSESNDWAYEWTDLDKYEDGDKIVWTVVELDADGNAVTDAYNDDYSTAYEVEVKTAPKPEPLPLAMFFSLLEPDKVNNDGKTTVTTITNKHVPEKIEIPVEKVWDDDDDRDGCRPESVEVTLSSTNDSTFTPITVELNERNGWKYTFTDLYKYYDHGKLVEYKVEETKTEVITGVDKAKQYAITITGDQTEGFTVTNKHTPEVIKVKGVKKWFDELNRDGLRPASIEVYLLADGKVIKTITVNQNTDWTFEFTNLFKYRDHGVEIVYTLAEKPVPNYSTLIEGDFKKGFTIRNGHEPKNPPKPPVPNTGDDSNINGWIGAMLVSFFGMVAALLGKKRKSIKA